MRRGSARMAAPLLLAALAAACATAPEPTPAALVALRSVEYVKRDERALLADVVRPEGDGPFPAVLLVHGGSWQRGSRERMAGIADRLARRGYVAVSIDYRFAPEHRFPAQLHDCRAALRWMRSDAGRLRVDPDRIAGFGYSAGGHLVGLLAMAADGDGLDEGPEPEGSPARLQAAVLGGAPIALDLLPANRAVERLLGASARERPDLYARASPLSFVTPDDPPVFLYHGADDWIVAPAHARMLHEALARAGVPSGYYESPGGHVTTFLRDEEAVSRAIDFLDRTL